MTKRKHHSLINFIISKCICCTVDCNGDSSAVSIAQATTGRETPHDLPKAK